MMERAHDPELKIAERYFLGELTDDDAEAFEAHYFECPRCAEYVVEELAMLESGREVARAVQPAQPAPRSNVVPLQPRRRVFTWLSAAAAAVVVFAAGMPMLVRAPIPRLDSVEPIQIQFSENRAFAALAPTRPEGPPVVLDVEIPPEAANFPHFALTVRNQANEVVDKRHTYPAERADESILLVLGELPAGTYNVAIEGVSENGNRSPIASQPFEVRGEPRKEGEP